jgi:Predicted integral membrane protein
MFMKQNKFLTLGTIVIALAPIIYIAIIWNQIPETVALHFNGEFQPDRMGAKSNLWLSAGILCVVSIGLYFLLSNIQYLDPKRRGLPPSMTFVRMGFGLSIFLSALNFIIICSSIRGASVISNLLFPLMGLLFAFIGNYLNNIKPNYFVGLRLPWTLSDDNNWRKTHQIASKLWFWGGLFFAVLSFFLPVQFIIPLMIVVILVLTIIPIVYSFRLFKKTVS